MFNTAVLAPNTPQACLTHIHYMTHCVYLGPVPTELSNSASIWAWQCIYMVNISIKEREILTLEYLIKIALQR